MTKIRHLISGLINQPGAKAIRRLIAQLCLFAIILLALINLPQYLTTCYYWGNPGILPKMRLLADDSETYNTYFFGSSRIHRHINPILFDELTTAQTTSYNLGFVGTYVPESYYLLERFLADMSEMQQGFILIELQEIRSLPYDNVGTTRAKYYLTPKDMQFVIEGHLENETLNNNRKYRAIRNYAFSFVEKTLGIGLLQDFTKNSMTCIGFDEKALYPMNQAIRGFYSLEAEFADTSAADLKQRYDDLQSDLSVIGKREQEIREGYQIYQDYSVSATHLDRIQTLISRAKEKGYHLIFVLPPRLPQRNYLQLLPVFDQIGDQHKIDLANPDQFPEFYVVETSFDIGHFDDVGSKLFTETLAKKFNELALGLP
ncbi:MAG: hypothetical protein AAF629_00715 [Chloroflexota bacterium]